MGEPRNAFHIFLFVVAALNGALLTAGVPTSSVIDRQLPDFGAHIYGFVLLAGALSVLVGMYWPGYARDGLLLKRWGYVALCVATLVYSTAVMITQPGTEGFLASSITFAFSGICGWTIHRINRRVHAVIVLTEVGDGRGGP